MRHSWELLPGCSTTFKCRRCKCIKQSVPHPYARQWVLRYWWTAEDGGDGQAFEKAPPCEQREASNAKP